MTRKYELVYIVSPEASDAQVAELHTQVEQIAQRLAGTIEKTDNWGRRKLAYEIGPHKEGTYVLETINGSGELMKEIDRRLKVSDLIIRHLVVRVDEEETVIERVRNRRTETTRRRRVARGLPPDRQPGEGQRGEVDDDRDDRFDLNEGLER
jgi:small subunit ribosomal protein S6